MCHTKTIMHVTLLSQVKNTWSGVLYLIKLHSLGAMYTPSTSTSCILIGHLSQYVYNYPGYRQNLVIYWLRVVMSWTYLNILQIEAGSTNVAKGCQIRTLFKSMKLILKKKNSSDHFLRADRHGIVKQMHCIALWDIYQSKRFCLAESTDFSNA